MPSSDYSGGGKKVGALKFKGDSGIDKKKKKKKQHPASDSSQVKASLRDTPSQSTEKHEHSSVEQWNSDAEHRQETELLELEEEEEVYKTEAERKHELLKRKRLLERLKKDGVKTHKQRVEDLNKYLSGLSEHHDMPKIGPG